MWIAKGLLLGAWLISFGSFGFSYFAHYYKMPDVLIRIRTANPVWWFWWIAAIAIGLIVARSWRGNRVVWIGLAMTELVPLGLWTMALMN